MKKPILFTLIVLPGFLIFSCKHDNNFNAEQEKEFILAAENGILTKEGFNRCTKYLNAWLELADPETGLIPRNIRDSAGKDIWNARDCAADNYPFMVLTSALLERSLFEGRMRQMLETEIRLTSRLGSLPDTYSFSKKGFLNADTILSEIIFGSAEYVKDGLIPLTEWLGMSPWSDRMISILDDMWEHAVIDTPYGRICSVNHEVNGDLLQSLSRIYWITGERKYLEWACRLGDYYLLGKNHPAMDFKVLRLRDHGCEIVGGLCELYATVSFADPPRKKLYQESLYRLLDRILEAGRNEDGLFYNSIDPVKGIPVDSSISDSFGYLLDGFYTVYMVDQEDAYRKPVITSLEVLNRKYKNYPWEGTSHDGYADAIEGALNLYIREPVPSAKEWLDSEIRVMWNKQQSSGIIEGWHGDGNFARTTIMYCLWKTGGVHPDPWRDDLELGAVLKDDKLFLSLGSGSDWEGKLVFDKKRHKVNLHLPFDWPRINQFPEYFTVEKENEYYIMSDDDEQIISGEKLSDGLPVKIRKGKNIRYLIEVKKER